jgi:RNA polymerase sigma factor (TIGR02999 family)
LSGSREITALLADWSRGDQAALDRLLPIVYDELRGLASAYMRRERPEHLLQTTALVHEAYLRLVDRERVSFQNKAQFYAVAAQVMRRVLVDYARTRDRAKRGHGVAPLALEDVAVVSEERADELIVVNSALDGLSKLDPRKGKVFEMRYFAGMSVEEVAEALSVSPVTVARDWRMAKIWLRREMSPPSPHAT